MARKKKKNRILPFTILIAVIVIIIIVVASRSNKDNSIQVAVDAVEKRSITETVYASGNLYPVVEVEITSNVSGTIVDLLVEEGEEVKEGQLLAKIDPEALASVVERSEAAANTASAQLESVKAQKEQLKAQFNNAKIIYERNQELFEEGVIAKAELETALASYETALANMQAADENIRAAEFSVKSAEATVREQRNNLSQTRIYAPMSGVVSVLYKKKGEQVVGTAQMAGTPILKIANLNSVETQVKVNERDILKVNIGDTADIELDAYPERKFTGVVTQIANTANNITALALSSDQVIDFKVHILILAESYQDLIADDGSSPFRAGLSASTEIRTNTIDDIMTVPIGAVTARVGDGKKQDEDAPEKNNEEEELNEFVFVAVADSVRIKQVTTGIQDDDYIQLLSGVAVGDSVVIAPYEAIKDKLEDGSKIKVVPEDDLYKKVVNPWEQ